LGGKLDFFKIKERNKNGVVEIYPDFKICRSKDLMVRSKSFYAIWDEERGVWSTDEYDVQRLVDVALKEHASKITEAPTKVRYMADWSSKAWHDFRSYMSHISDNAHQLDENLTFANQEVSKNDYVSKRLQYPIEDGVRDSYEELVSTLYSPEERAKIEWAIGAIISGEAKNIQKFIVLYGEAGTGKSTILNIIQKLFEGYYTTFEAKSLTSNNNSFSTEAFSNNPLVAIQHDGDLSKIEDNSKLNSIISHEMMTINQKYRAQYMARINCFLFMATNRPVRITDAKSGIIRRLIDVRPTGDNLTPHHYNTVMSRIDFELSAIAAHCLSVYNQMGKNYYSSYRPIEMMYQTDTFFNFVEAYYHYFVEEDGVSLIRAYTMYKTFCEESLIEYKLPRYKFREELKSYFKKFEDVARIDGKQVRNYYSKFKTDKFKQSSSVLEKASDELILDKTKSIFDKVYADSPAQYATENEVPKSKWVNVKTKLKDIDTTKLHYVKPPENLIVIDFDLKDSGGKNAELNLRAASEWPPTYAEFSKGGSGVHLHYIYAGDVASLETVYGPGIEVKTFTGNSSLRRRLSHCNGLAVNTLVSGLAVKEQKTMIDLQVVKTERGIRTMIERNLSKEFHPGTKPSIDFIYKILDDAYISGVGYDVTDMRPRILAFATNSTNQADTCIKLVNKMKFKSEEILDTAVYDTEELVFFDVEVFPNLFIICWKAGGKPVVKMINPKSSDIEELLRYKLVGFNNRRYDNHILYARYLGFNNQQIYLQSQRLIENSSNATFGEAYNLSYTDIYDFSSKKQSLKKWEIELGIHHKELGMNWNEPVPEELWDSVADYCANDVDATEYVFNYLSADWTARQILAELSGLSVNCTTQMHAAKIIFGNDREPQSKFVYTHLSEMFPGYKFDYGKSTYKGIETGEGGYVYGEPGLYTNVALLDVVSMHPNSIINLKLFGPYTERFREIVEARVAIKNGRYSDARKMFNGALDKHLGSEGDSAALGYALKIIINIVYGLTSARFQNKFKDPRNIDNIVAKRGALFMVDLKESVQEKGFTVAHIKTDSIKIPNATPEIIEFVKDFGAKYGYEFEHEDTFAKMCLVNDAVYIAKTNDGHWKAVGAQFQNPYVYKMLFSKEPITVDDLVEAKAVKTALYLDMNEDLPEDEHNYVFVGKVGAFVPVLSGHGGGVLYREKDGKYYAATGTKGYRWLEVETVKELNIPVDYDHHNKLVEEAKKTLSEYGPLDEFIS
jgi:energy-coupling factor transporter ATP-binding protein EcfA2